MENIYFVEFPCKSVSPLIFTIQFLMKDYEYNTTEPDYSLVYIWELSSVPYCVCFGLKILGVSFS